MSGNFLSQARATTQLSTLELARACACVTHEEVVAAAAAAELLMRLLMSVLMCVLMCVGGDGKKETEL